jgi:hypothetical protein
MHYTRSLAVRILLAAAAALWAVLVPGQAAALMNEPLACPRWLRPRARQSHAADTPPSQSLAIAP